METFASILEKNSGVAPGFDFVRLFLATIIVLWHCFDYTHPHEAAEAFWASPLAPAINSAVPLFFSLSGFLVTGSLLRLGDLRLFVAFRALRIIPALLVEICISAIILGPIVTTFSLYEYFANPNFFSYFSNIVGIIKFQLPGVFKDQFYDQVNGALWTVPGEISCYLTLISLTLLGISKRRIILLLLFVIMTIGVYLWTRKVGAFSTQNWVPLVFCFYAGCLFFHFAEFVPSHWSLAIAALVLAYYTMQFRFGLYIVVAPTMLAYLVCFLGMQQFPRIKYLMDGDHSYGIYLYHCPIIQALVWLTNSNISWWQSFFASYIAVSVIAMFSWKFIERPALTFRKVIVAR